MEFTSQICTTKEQSERLLALGLKAETADMYTTNMSIKGINYTDDWKIGSIPYRDAISFLNSQGLQLENTFWSVIPAWSLHRLLSMLPEYIDELEAELAVNQSSCGYTNDDEWVYFTEESDNIYDNIITCIEWLIKMDYFNKEYLN